MEIAFEGEIWFWRGPAPWYFVTVPEHEAADLKTISEAVTYGWGMIPVTARVGNSMWTTSLFPKDGRYIVPIKAAIRKAERLEAGDVIFLHLQVN